MILDYLIISDANSYSVRIVFVIADPDLRSRIDNGALLGVRDQRFTTGVEPFRVINALFLAIKQRAPRCENRS